MPEPTRQYIFSEGQVRFAFVASGVGMVTILVLLLVLVSSRPQGRLAPADTSQFENTLEVATARLEGYEVLENGRARIDIDRAMELVAERGVTLQLTASDVSADEAAQENASDPAGEGADGVTAELPDGSQVYAQCAGCHQQNGQGVPGAFPPLAGHAPDLYNAEGGPTYLVDVILYGLQGQIEVEGQSYSGLMPAWQQLTDAQIAAVLNFVLTEWGNEAELDTFEPYAAADIEAQRGQGLSTSDMLDRRGSLELP